MLKRVIGRLRDAKKSRNNLGSSPIYYLILAKKYIFRTLLVKFFFRKHGFCAIDIERYAFCNRKCTFCFNHADFLQREKGQMPLKSFKKVIDQLSKIGFIGRLSPIFYNEPLLDKELPNIIEYARKKLPNCCIHISTNGDFLTEKIFRDLYRRGADFFLVTNYDDRENPKFIDLANKYPFHINLRSYKSFAKIDRAGQIFKRKKQSNAPCMRPSSQVVINWKGDVLLCCQDFYGKYVMGNIEKDTLVNIWNSKTFFHYRNILSKGQRARIKLCKYCDMTGEIAW